jgi:hypothetical protein
VLWEKAQNLKGRPGSSPWHFGEQQTDAYVCFEVMRYIGAEGRQQVRPVSNPRYVGGEIDCP